MNVTDTKTKPINPEPTASTEAEAKASKPKAPNKLLDAVTTTTPPSASERENVLNFMKLATEPQPKPAEPLKNPLPNVPATPVKNAGGKLLGALPPNPANTKEFLEGAKVKGPNATIGPIAEKAADPPLSAEAKERNCRALVEETVGAVPLIGKRAAMEVGDACAPDAPAPTVGALPNVKMTAPKGTALGKADP